MPTLLRGIAWYWGALGQKEIDVIVSGAVGKTDAIGCRKALDMDESLKMLKEKGIDKTAYVAIPPIFLAE